MEKLNIALIYQLELLDARSTQIAKELESTKKLVVLGKLYCMALLSEDEYTAVKKKIMREYNVVSFMNI